MRTAIAAWALVCLPSAAFADAAPLDAQDTGAPYFVVTGAEARLDPLPLREVAVHADISGVVADVTVTQLWENTGATPLDATYVFPLSTRAAVHALEMRVGGRRIVARIEDKEVAREGFEAARDKGQRAALLEQQRPNVFTTEVANIQPGEVVEIELAYVELLRPVDGVFSFIAPRAVGPRYVSASEAFPDLPWSADAVADAPRSGPELQAWPVSVSLMGGVPVQWAGSSTHPVVIDHVGNTLEVELADLTPDTTRDFVLDFALGAEALTTGVLVEPDEDGDGGHFLALIAPPERAEPELVPAREVVFIVDTSGSMQGWPLASGRELVGLLVDALGPSDHVNVLAFAGSSERLAPASLPATDANKARAREFIGSREGGGGTELLAALRDALDLPATPGLARTFVLVTDGYVTVEAEAIDLIRARAADATVLAVGLGDGVNRHLIETVAHAGQGEPYVAQSEAEARDLVERIADDARAPILTDIALDFEGFDAFDVEPRAIPTLYAARPILVTGRYRGAPGGTLVLSGRTGRGPWRAVTPIAGGERHPAVPLLWARERIARLSDFAGAMDAPDHVPEITALGLAYHLVTRYTSFVVIDDGHEVTQRTPASTGLAFDVQGLGAMTGGGSGGLGFSGSGRGGSGVGHGRIGVLSGAGELDAGGGDGKTVTPPPITLALSVLGPDGKPAPSDVIVAFKRRLAALRHCLEAAKATRAQSLVWELFVTPEGAIARRTHVRGTLPEVARQCIDRNLARVALTASTTARRLRLALDVRR